MADPWPVSLPQLPALPSGFSIPWGVDRTAFDVGPGQTRLVTTANREPWDPGAIILRDATELATLRTFLETTLVRMSLPFETTYFGSTRDVRIVAAPEIMELGGDRYRVILSLEVLPV